MPRQVTLDTLNVYRFEVRFNEAGEAEIILHYTVTSAAEKGVRIPGEVAFAPAELTTDERRAVRLLMARLKARVELQEGI